MNNDRISSKVLLFVMLVLLCVTFMNYQLMMNINEVSSKIDSIGKGNEVLPDEVQNGEIPDDLIIQDEKFVKDVEYIKGLEPIELNNDTFLENVRNNDVLSNIFSSGIKSIKYMEDWEFGEVYIVNASNKIYLMQTYLNEITGKNEIYSIIDSETEKATVIREDSKIEKNNNLQSQIYESADVGKVEYTEYAIRFENPSKSNGFTENKPHLVHYLIMGDAVDTPEFTDKVGMMMSENNWIEVYVYRNVETLEQDLESGKLDVEGIERANGCVLHLTDGDLSENL